VYAGHPLGLGFWPFFDANCASRFHPGIGFRGSMAGLCPPLPTLRRRPYGRQRTARGRCGPLLLHRSGLAPPTPCRSPRRTSSPTCPARQCSLYRTSPVYGIARDLATDRSLRLDQLVDEQRQQFAAVRWIHEPAAGPVVRETVVVRPRSGRDRSKMAVELDRAQTLREPKPPKRQVQIAARSGFKGRTGSLVHASRAVIAWSIAIIACSIAAVIAWSIAVISPRPVQSVPVMVAAIPHALA
jgi:hypothetical protein